MALFWGQECPLCGEPMRIKVSETIVKVPGQATANTRKLKEWVCPECEYFEEAGDDDR